ncbi:MAG TPA: DUF2520 domain-containing protein [Sphingobacteriaceae bacterium]|nr:DUF2520 domain-containing protein [Sphingobacteriaceae bacterium]
MGLTVAIIGAGRVGTAVGSLLHRAGYEVGGVVSRSLPRAEEAVAIIGGGRPAIDVAKAVAGAHIVFLTVPDQHIAAVAAEARAAAGGSLQVMIHASGVLPASIMGGGSGDKPIGLLSLHPMQSVADRRRGAQVLQGAYWGLEGDEEAYPLGERLVRAMGGIPLFIKPGGKGLYHGAACITSNYLVSLMDMGLRLMEEAGIPRDRALPVLAHLMKGTMANMEAMGVPAALTGPIERGDTGTIARHLEAMAQAPGGRGPVTVEDLYRRLGLYTVELARGKRAAQGENGNIEERLQQIADLLEGRPAYAGGGGEADPGN